MPVIAITLLAAALILLPAAGAHASISSILCGVWGMIKNDIARGIGTLAIAGLAVGAIFGKVSWGMAVMVSVGLIITVSAATIANSITGVTVCAP